MCSWDVIGVPSLHMRETFPGLEKSAFQTPTKTDGRGTALLSFCSISCTVALHWLLFLFINSVLQGNFNRSFASPTWRSQVLTLGFSLWKAGALSLSYSPSMNVSDVAEFEHKTPASLWTFMKSGNILIINNQQWSIHILTHLNNYKPLSSF